jgi:hypothetical protein
MEFVYLLMLLASAIALHLLITIKMEQSVFLTVCLFFIIMFVSGLRSSLSTGFYIIVALSIVSAAFILYKAIVKKIKLLDIATPGITIFIVAYVVYYFSTQGALLHLWDEATHWGTTAKKMYYYNELWTSGLQTFATPLFHQVMLKLTGYKESALYLSQWVLFLACIILPLSGIRWKKGYLAALFAIAAIFALSAIFQDGNLSLYADAILAFFFAALVVGWFVEKERNWKKYIWAGAGIFMLVQLKSGSGASLAAMFVIFAMLTDTLLFNENKTHKKLYLDSLKSIAFFVVVIIISSYTYGSFEDTFTGNISGGGALSKELITSAAFIIFSALMLVTLILFTLYSINIFKNNLSKKAQKKINTWLIVSSSLTFVAMLAVLFYTTILRPDFDVRTTVLNFISAFQDTYMLGMPVIYLVAVISAVFIINVFLSHKSQRKQMIVFYSAAFFFSGLFIVGVLYAYLSSFSLGEAVNMASFDRYIGTAIMFAVIFAMAPFANGRVISIKNNIKTYALLGICTMLLGTQYIPSYKATQVSRQEALVFRQTEIKAAEYVKDKVGSDAKVFLVLQGDKGFVFNWMRYEFTPLTTNGGYWAFGDDGGANRAWPKDRLRTFLNDAHYDYLYIFNTDEYFINQFGHLFGEHTPESKTLYKFSNSDGTVFTPME